VGLVRFTVCAEARTEFCIPLRITRRPVAVGLVHLTVSPEARAGLKFPILPERSINVGLVSFTVFLESRIGLGFPLRTTRKAYHRGFGQLAQELDLHFHYELLDMLPSNFVIRKAYRHRLFA
jgi:hypothetical protein